MQYIITADIHNTRSTFDAVNFVLFIKSQCTTHAVTTFHQINARMNNSDCGLLHFFGVHGSLVNALTGIKVCR